MALVTKGLLFSVKTPPTLGTIQIEVGMALAMKKLLFSVKTPPTLGTISYRGRNGFSHEEVAIQR
ncbi:hypothetical protein D0907_05470 [Pseudoalteromonas lipolytica]|uniref:Uncharacterized protein n=1 Tax=Pseudoalteromonas lipolytica TaxID=570156 RepID=A0AAD0RY61_9GAMM|nr:hypothetical protein D0907_05470 [Pseudoalteromonas donghaensis]